MGSEMAATVWKGYVAFGMISIPIRLFVAARDVRIGFHQIHRVCGSRIRQQIYCPVCERTVERSELAKGYEYAKDRYVLIEPEDINKVAPPSTRTMEIQQFVKVEEVDPLYYDMSYYALPEEAGKRAYALLVETMERTGFAGLAKVGMHQREYVVVIRSRDKGLTLHTMHYPEEVRQLEGYGDLDVELKEQELKVAEQLLSSLVAPFRPESFRDEFQQRVVNLVEAKMGDKEVKPSKEPKRLAPVVDLMEALQKSLAQAEGKKPAAREAPAKKKRAAKRPARKAA